MRVIALTANVMRSDVERARSAGFDGFIGNQSMDGVFLRYYSACWLAKRSGRLTYETRCSVDCV